MCRTLVDLVTRFKVYIFSLSLRFRLGWGTKPTINSTLLPTAYVVRREGNVFTRVCPSIHQSVCPHREGVGYPSQVQLGGGTPARSSLGGYPDRGGTQGGIPPHQTWTGGYPDQGGTRGGVPHQTWTGGYPDGGYPRWGTPHWTWMGVPQGGVPEVGYPPSDLDRGGTLMGVPKGVPPIRPGWGYPNRGVPEVGYPPVGPGWGYQMGGYPRWGTPPYQTWTGGYPDGGGGTPLRLTDGVLDKRRSVCLLRSRRRTFLLSIWLHTVDLLVNSIRFF